MKLKHLSLCTALAVAVAIVACSKSTPTSPSTSSTAATPAASDASTGAPVGTSSVSITSPVQITPADGQKFRYADQPLTLTVRNAAATGSGAVTYTFQVASDAAFTNLVSTKDSVAQGANGQTSTQIDMLAGNANYFWRVRANAGGGAGLFFKSRTFFVGPQVVIQAPAQVSPSNGGTSNGAAPTLTVSDSARTGPAGAITYRFEVSDSSSFANLIGVATVGEQSGQTTASVNGNFTANATYYWRVRADDVANGVSSPYSSVWSFKYVPFDMHQAIIMNSPYDLADWAQTGTITSIVFTPDAFLVDFDKRDGPNRWPDTPFGAGSLEYTLGMCLNINSQWYCSAVVQFWYGRELSASTPPWNVATAWFYDGARWGPMAGHQPQDGETVGIFACAGNCRNNTAGDASYVKERTNVALIPWTNEADESFTFTVNGLIRTLQRGRRR